MSDQERDSEVEREVKARIRVGVAGALGRMGQETVKAVFNDQELQLVGVADPKGRGKKLSEVISVPGLELPVCHDVAEMIDTCSPDVVVDFTTPHAVYDNARTILSYGVAAVVGTTGLGEQELQQLEILAREKNTGIAVIPNFAIGAVLMMRFAKEAAKYFSNVEIIELHHDQKLDAPSGTAVKTAEMINEALAGIPPRVVQETVKLPGCRGGVLEAVRVHSVRLPGLVAHQEVIFGGPGQALTIRHDSYNRESFMPGVLMAVKKMTERKGMVYGLENLL